MALVLVLCERNGGAMKVLLAVLLTGCFAGVVWAHQATDLKFDYSHNKKVLTVEFVHVSTKRHKHFIRKLELIREGKDIQEFYYVMQDQTKDETKKIPVVLMGKESVLVRVYCSEGGIQEASFVVPLSPDE
jgi:hypothetical protein